VNTNSSVVLTNTVQICPIHHQFITKLQFQQPKPTTCEGKTGEFSFLTVSDVTTAKDLRVESMKQKCFANVKVSVKLLIRTDIVQLLKHYNTCSGVTVYSGTYGDIKLYLIKTSPITET
jgi:hypothetical protein